MKNNLYLGIDTSNYTTSAALCDETGTLVKSVKRPLPVKEGECGLRQSDALFAHVVNLPDVMREIQANLSDRRLCAVGFSARPRDVEGSYMPCFAAGAAAAATPSAAAGLPLYDFSHQSGHIMAAVYSSGRTDYLKGDFAAFHISGGTSELLYVTPKRDGFDIKLLGGTLDLHAGQVIDRVGVLLGLSFPCGPALETLALQYTGERLKTKTCVFGYNYNLSGLENLAGRIFRDSGDKGKTAAYVIDFISDTIEKVTEHLLREYPDLPVLYAGGVMSNSIIKEKLSGKFSAAFAEPEFSSDNAYGTALLCRARHLSRKTAYKERVIG